MRADPRITLIITTYNWPAALDLTLRSVARQSMLPDEVIVADDGSGPQTRQVVTQWEERLRSPLVHVCTRLQNSYDFWCAAISRSCPTINPL